MIAIAFLFICMLYDCSRRRKLKSWYCRISCSSAHHAVFGRPRSVHLALSSLSSHSRRGNLVRPETVRWNRMGFAAYWRWQSRPRRGRARIGKEVRDLIRRMSIENPLWETPKVHGDLLKLGIDVAQSTVSIYMVPRQGRPLQSWKIFLRNDVEEICVN